MSARAVEVVRTTNPANSQGVILFDSTWWHSPDKGWEASQHATAGAYLPPGPFRGRFSRAIVQGTVRLGAGDNCTLYEQVLTGVAGAFADWETESTGTLTLTAASTTPIEWRPQGPEFRLWLVAGADNPASQTTRLSIIPVTYDFGV
jgi:hypothetical protein